MVRVMVMMLNMINNNVADDRMKLGRKVREEQVPRIQGFLAFSVFQTHGQGKQEASSACVLTSSNRSPFGEKVTARCRGGGGGHLIGIVYDASL